MGVLMAAQEQRMYWQRCQTCLSASARQKLAHPPADELVHAPDSMLPFSKGVSESGGGKVCHSCLSAAGAGMSFQLVAHTSV